MTGDGQLMFVVWQLSDEQLTVLGHDVCCLSNDQLPMFTRLVADTVHKLQSGICLSEILEKLLLLSRIAALRMSAIAPEMYI